MSFDSRNSLIVGGVLELVAIAKLLGINHPFEPKRKLTKNEVVSSTEVRQYLSATPIQVSIVFNSEVGLTVDDLLEYFLKYNSHEPQFHSPVVSSLLSKTPISEFVESLASTINLDEYGGWSRSAIRLNKSEQGIVAEGTLVKLVLGAIGGASPQDKNRVDDFNTNKGKFSEAAIELARSHIIVFLTVWLDGVKEQFVSDRDGFHYSPSLWLAIGLLINRLNHSDEDEVAMVAKQLSKLDYSRSAEHWVDCEVMVLDGKGSEYKNASGGGRPFRIGLANYLAKQAELTPKG